MRRKNCWTRALIAALGLAALSLAAPAPVRCEERVLRFPPTSFEILDPATGQVIGHGNYTFDHVTAGVVLKGESRYLNGDYDVEEDRMVVESNRPVPVLASFRHTFYAKDGSIQREGRADVRAGIGWCETAAAERQKIESARFDFPPDTYAGASILVPLQNYLKRGETDTPLHLHVFTCVPGPKLLKVEAEPGAETRWNHYPGKLEQVNVTPDFGMWNLFLLPFIPKTSAWFDPAAGWNFVGANLARYYRGPKITLVKTH